MPDGHQDEHWHIDKKITLNQILAIVVQSAVLIAAIAVFWWWLNSSITEAADKASTAATQISEVAVDVGDVEEKTDEAMILARSNHNGLVELRSRVARNEERQTRRDQEVINRLERIEGLLLEKRQP